jgi:hypothetical protein
MPFPHRFPGSSCPKEALTGDAVLDAYLQDLDGKLLGASAVRVLTLVEIKDHLQERKDAAVEKGLADDAAAKKAVDEMGPASAHAGEQRAALLRRFRTHALTLGVMFGVTMGLFGVLGVAEAGGLALVSHVLARPAFLLRFTFNTLFFGLFMGWFLAFVWPQRRLPQPGVGAAFTVGYSAALLWLGRVMTVLFAASGVCLLAGALAPGVFLAAGHVQVAASVVGYGRISSLVLGLLSIWNAKNFYNWYALYEVGERGFEIRRWGMAEAVPWSCMTSLRPLGEIKRWIPTWNYWRKVLALDYASPGGKARRVYIFPDTTNADRFALLVREKLAKAPPPESSPYRA